MEKEERVKPFKSREELMQPLKCELKVYVCFTALKFSKLVCKWRGLAASHIYSDII